MHTIAFVMALMCGMYAEPQPLEPGTWVRLDYNDRCGGRDNSHCVGKIGRVNYRWRDLLPEHHTSGEDDYCISFPFGPHYIPQIHADRRSLTPVGALER